MDVIVLLAPAFLAGAFASLAHVPLGQEVLRRGIIFLDLAVAQCAATGMILFQLFFHDMAGWTGQAGLLLSGLIFALGCALAFHRLEPVTGRYQEALIGCVFVGAAALGLLLMAHDPHGGQEMKDILAGQVLWTNWRDIALAAPLYGFALIAWVIFARHRQAMFYPLFALIIPLSVHLLGVYLVFATLIFPALATARKSRAQGIGAYGLSLGGYTGGLILSYHLDWPAGPTIIMVLALFSLTFSAVFGRYRH